MLSLFSLEFFLRFITILCWNSVQCVLDTYSNFRIGRQNIFWMEQIYWKKNLGPGKGNKVLQVLRKMIATRFEKKSGIFKRGKRPSFKFGIWVVVVFGHFLRTTWTNSFEFPQPTFLRTTRSPFGLAPLLTVWNRSWY